MEYSSKYYDHIFSTEEDYKCDYLHSSYFPIWYLISRKLQNTDKILDLGCGPGQFANMLSDEGFKSYTGIDFSETAIIKASELNPNYAFINSDLMDVYYKDLEGYVIIACEVFEHLEDDRALIRKLPETRLIFSVPNYTAPNHYRTYESEHFIQEYYKGLLHIKTIDKFQCNDTDCIFIVDSLITH